MDSHVLDSYGFLDTTDDDRGGDEVKKETKWEKYDRLSKDELVIRLVKAEAEHKIFIGTVISLAKDGTEWHMPNVGERPPKEWLKKIVAFAKEHPESKNGYWSMELVNYGVAYSVAKKLLDEEG